MELEVPKFDYEGSVEKIVGFIKEVVKGAKAAGVVVGLSGGVDSSLAVALCVRALGKEGVLGVIMPISFTPEQDVKDAQDLAEWLEIKTELVEVQKISEAFFEDLRCKPEYPNQKMPRANILARIRMIILYYYANCNNYLVVGTGDRSEAIIGYFTKYGDGGADFMPIRHLYKTQVRELASYLGVPEHVAYKPSSPQLYPGHKITDEVPLSYDKLDPVLVGMFDKKLPLREVSQLAEVPVETIHEVLRRFKVSEHKRRYPPSLG